MIPWNYKNENKIFMNREKNGVPYLSFSVLEETGLVLNGFSTRLGGASRGKYATMNFAWNKGDDPADVLENYTRMAEALGTDRDRMVASQQTHTTNVRLVTEKDAGKGVVRERDYTDVDGLITNLLVHFGMAGKNYHVEPGAFPWVYTITNVWKGFGFASILYCSIISSIDPGLYEAAKLDGANRWQQVWHVTLPGLKAVIAINLITTVGAILATNTELILLLYTPATYDVADVIGTYTYRLGILEGQYSYTTAAGLFTAIIGFGFTYAANKISNKLTGYGLW